MATLRPMSLADLDEVYALECVLFGASAWPKETLEKDMELFYFDVLEEEGKIVGYCSLAINGDFADILNIGVDPLYRRRKYASTMMHYMINRAFNEGALNVTLEVRISNSSAIALYESFGFKKAAKRKQYYQDGEDAYLMILERSHA